MLYYVDLPRNHDNLDETGVWCRSKAEAVREARRLAKVLSESNCEYADDTIYVYRVSSPHTKAELIEFLNHIADNISRGTQVFECTFTAEEP